MPDRRFSDRVLVHAVGVHADDHHRRTLVHHHVRHPSEPAAQAGRLRQHNGRRLAVLGRHGRLTADGHERLLQDQVKKEAHGHDSRPHGSVIGNRVFWYQCVVMG